MNPVTIMQLIVGEMIKEDLSPGSKESWNKRKAHQNHLFLSLIMINFQFPRN